MALRTLVALSEAQSRDGLHRLVGRADAPTPAVVRRGRGNHLVRTVTARIGAVLCVLAVILLYVLLVRQLPGPPGWGAGHGPFDS